MITPTLVEAARGLTPDIEEACETLLVLAAAEKMSKSSEAMLLTDAFAAQARIAEWLDACLSAYAQ